MGCWGPSGVIHILPREGPKGQSGLMQSFTGLTVRDAECQGNVLKHIVFSTVMTPFIIFLTNMTKCNV